MEQRKLELTLLSAENLKEVNLITRLYVYAVVSIGIDPQSSQTIPPDRHGGRNPVWNSTLHLPLPARGLDPCSRHLALRIALRTERPLGDRDVGDVAIPLWDLVRDNPYGDVRSVSWMVRKPTSAKTKGVLNFSYRIVGGAKGVAPPAVVRAGSKRRSGLSGSRRGGLVGDEVVFFDKVKAAGC